MANLSLPSSPAAQRNRVPIAEVLREVLPAQGQVLEIASGTGEHAAWFAQQFPQLRWQPTDADEASLPIIAAHVREYNVANVEPPLLLDATAPQWPVEQADALLCINMVHISPWRATVGLMLGAGRLLPSSAPLILYGPYRRARVPTAPSNEGFDQSLRTRNSEWGLRHLEAVVAEAEANGLLLEQVVEMPANNLTVVFRRSKRAEG